MRALRMHRETGVIELVGGIYRTKRALGDEETSLNMTACEAVNYRGGQGGT